MHGLPGCPGGPGGQYPLQGDSGRRIRCWRIGWWRRLVHYISGRKLQHTNGRSDGTQHHLLRFRKRAACVDASSEEFLHDVGRVQKIHSHIVSQHTPIDVCTHACMHVFVLVFKTFIIVCTQE